MDKEEWSKEKLKKLVQCEITKLFSTILDYVEVAVDGKARYKNLRSKILKVSNDSIRDIHKELDTKYKVDYALGEDIIVVDQHGR